MEELVWLKIEGESLRIYHFPGGEKFEVHLVEQLCVRPSGNHRLITQRGQKIIVKSGWLAIEIIADKWSA